MISSQNQTIIKGIFTTCENDNCPPWSLQSEIQHDKEDKVIRYKNAWLNFDIPIFLFSKFFHPDPTVKRQSGFLIPSITSSSNSKTH